MLIEVLRIVDIPADYEVHYGHSEITLHAGFEFLAYNIYTCTVDKAKNGYAPSMITDLPALQNKPNDPSTSICSMNSSESPSQLARFYESSNTLFVLSTALASSTVATSWIAVCIALSLRFCSMRTSTMSLGIPLKIKELLQAQQSKSDHLKTINISLTSIASVNDKERIKGSSLFQYYNYAIPGRMPTTSVVIVSPSSAVQSLSDSIQPNKSISGTSVAISRANPSTNQVKVHSSLSLIPMTNVTTYQDCFETYFDILATMSPQCLLNCVSLYPAFEVGVTTPDLVTRISVIVVEQLNFEDLQLLSLCSRTSSTQLQISAVSNLGMPKLHQKHLRGEVINGNPPHHLCRKSPPSRSNSKRSIHKRIVNKIRKRAPPPKRYLHRSDHHYSYGKLLWSQLRGKKMNSISLRKGLMFYASNVHSSLKYQRTERRSCCTTDSQCSLRPKQASVIPRAIEESQAFDRGVALFRGGKPSAQKSDPSASSGDDSDSDSSDTEADTSLQNPTSSHEASHSNGAMNLRPSSEAPPPLKMNSHVSQLGGEIDRNVQSSQSPAALITKSSERLLHSQGASNNYSEPLQNKQVSCISPPGNDGCQDSCIQPKLECYEDENKPPITRPQILEQAQEEVSPVLAPGQHNECVLMRPQHDNNADLAQPPVPIIENHPAQCAVVVSCSIRVSDSMTGPDIVGFGANVEVDTSNTAASPNCQAQNVVNHECQLAVIQRRLRGLILLMKFRCNRISRLLRRSQNNSYNDQLQAIRHALRDSVHEMHCIHRQWHVSQLQFQRIRTLLLHTDRDRLFELQQLSALHACHSLLHLQPRFEQINTFLLELFSQLQQANAYAAAQAQYAPPQPQANPQQAVVIPALLPGPENVMPFQAQVKEDNRSLVQTHFSNN